VLLSEKRNQKRRETSMNTSVLFCKYAILIRNMMMGVISYLFLCTCKTLHDKTMDSSISSNDTHLLDTSQIVHDIFTFPKINFLKRITDFDFLVFDHTTQIGNM